MSDAELSRVKAEIAELRARADSVEGLTRFLQASFERAVLARQQEAVLALLDSPELLEELAEWEHDERWRSEEDDHEAHIGQRHPNGELYEERWKRLRETLYADLTEDERASDRDVVKTTLDWVKEFLIEAWNKEEGAPS